MFFLGNIVNPGIVLTGITEVYRGRPAPGFDNDLYWEAEKEAHEAGRGMWSLGDKYISPKEWRKMQK